jgi:Fic family protein
MRVREKNDISQWFKFFLVGLIETANKGIKTFDNILQLQKQVDLDIQKLGSRAANAKKIINYLYQKPLIDAEKVSEVAKISYPSAYKIIRDLEKLDILKEITGGQRGRIYVFDKYVELFQ